MVNYFYHMVFRVQIAQTRIHRARDFADKRAPFRPVFVTLEIKPVLN